MLAEEEKSKDTYGDSLVKVNLMYNHAFGKGTSARKVPAHMPHMLDKRDLAALQARWPADFAATSSHRFRHSEDMQFAFAYFHWLLHTGDVVDDDGMKNVVPGYSANVCSVTRFAASAARPASLVRNAG